MKSKILRNLSFILSILLSLLSPLEVLAYEIDENDNSIESIEYQNIKNEEFDNKTNVFAKIGSTYSATIPKVIVLSSSSKSANYIVKVEGDIASYETINVAPDEIFNLYSENKDSQIANISQDNTSWTYSTINTIANGNISAPDITAGKWQGTFNFNINMNKVAGDVVAPDHEHNWQLFEHIVIPTCTQEGSDKYVCSECNSTEIRTVEANGHTNSSTMKEKEVKPTCTKTGSYDEVIYCTVCGDELSRILKTVNPLGHDYKEEVISPTHFEKGYSVFTCTRCNDSYIDKETEIIPHTYDDGIIAKQPTCTETGTKLYTCTCGNTKEEEIPALGHTEKNPVKENTIQPTCEKDGTYDEVIYCAVCDKKLSTTTKFLKAATGHKFGSYVDEKGKYVRTCSVCGKKEENGYVNYTISYTLNNGTASNLKTSYNAGTSSFTLPTPTRSNSYFVGWSGTGINGIQKTVTINKGSYGNRTYTANWSSNTTLKPFYDDNSVSYTYDNSTGYFNITQKGGTNGWGTGTICDDTGIRIPWGKEYCYSFDIKITTNTPITIDANICDLNNKNFSGGDNGEFINDYAYLDGTRLAHAQISGLSITPNEWHRIEIYFTNGHSKNTKHEDAKSFTSVGLVLTGKGSQTYQIRNISSRVVEK